MTSHENHAKLTKINESRKCLSVGTLCRVGSLFGKRFLRSEINNKKPINIETALKAHSDQIGKMIAVGPRRRSQCSSVVLEGTPPSNRSNSRTIRSPDRFNPLGSKF